MSDEVPLNDEGRAYLKMVIATSKGVRLGKIELGEYCSNFFLSMVSISVQGREFLWKPCLELVPDDLLDELSKFGDVNYRSTNYEVQSVGKFLGFSSKAATPEEKARISSTFRRLHQAIEQHIQSRAHTQGEGHKSESK